MSLLSKHIFISKDLHEVQDLNDNITAVEGKLQANALISFEAIPFQPTHNAEIIFFSSPRGVQFFLNQEEQKANVIYACVGKTTAGELVKHGIQPTFTGADNQSIEEIAEAFAVFAGESKVLFPSSDISLGTIASALPDGNAIQTPVYKTVLTPLAVDHCDIYVFTSPSNVRSFFKLNTLPENTLVIAWGNSTAKELKSFGVESKKLGTPSTKCLIEYLSEH